MTTEATDLLKELKAMKKEMKMLRAEMEVDKMLIGMLIGHMGGDSKDVIVKLRDLVSEKRKTDFETAVATAERSKQYEELIEKARFEALFDR